jgi:pimeloyl-ACP methyl ester carboxylesterase
MPQCDVTRDASQQFRARPKELELDRVADSVIVPRMTSRTEPEASAIEEIAPGSHESRRRSIFTRDVAARGARVRFVETGDGPPLLLVHGYLGSHSVWDDAVDGLSAHFRTLAPDLPGFGESEKPPAARYPYNVDAFAESLADLVASLELGRVVVCGHDLGGAVALMMAARHPAMVERLVLVDPIVYPHKPDLYTRLAGTPVVGPVAFKQLSGRGIFGAFFQRRNYAASGVVSSARIDMLFDAFNAPAAREAAYATLQSLADTRTLVALLPRVHAPALVVWGRNDRLLPVAHGRRLSRELPHARLEILDSGHSPHEEQPAVFAKIAHEFLTSGSDHGKPKSRPPRGRRDDK